MSTSPRLAIVTVTFNSSKVLPDFLRSLGRQSIEYRLYVIDNASVDRSPDIVEEAHDPRFVVIRNQENVGFAAGSNQGIALALEAGFTYVMLLNNDTEFPDSFIEEILAATRMQAYSLFAPKMYYHDDPTRVWFAGGYFVRWLGNDPRHIGEGEPDDPRFDRPMDIDLITGCCMLIDAKVFRAIGMLDPEYFAYLEDADFCLRARRAGFAMRYVPQARLFHKVSSLTGGRQSPFAIRLGARNRAYFLRKHHSKAAFIVYAGLYLWLMTLRLLSGRDTLDRYRMRVRSFREGLRIQPRRD